MDAVGRAAIGRAALAIISGPARACSQGAHGPSLEMLAQYIGKLRDRPTVRTKFGATVRRARTGRRGGGAPGLPSLSRSNPPASQLKTGSQRAREPVSRKG